MIILNGILEIPYDIKLYSASSKNKILKKEHPLILLLNEFLS